MINDLERWKPTGTAARKGLVYPVELAFSQQKIPRPCVFGCVLGV